MILYNGTKTSGDIKEFTIEHSKDGYVYGTSSRLVALEYMSNVFPDMFVSGSGIREWPNKYPKMFQGIDMSKELYIEIVPNFFEIFTKDREGWIYELEDTNDLEEVPQGKKCGHAHCFRSPHNLKVKNVQYISDVRSELQKYIDSGELQIIKYENVDKQFLLDKVIFFLDFDLKNHDHIKNNYVDYIRDFYKDKSLT